MESSQRKVAYFLSHPIQYFSPLLKEMSKEMDLDVYYYSDNSIKGHMDSGFGTEVSWDIPLLDGYKSTFLNNYRPPRAINNGFMDVFNPGVWKIVRQKNTKVVIVNGWTYSSNWMVLLMAKLYRKKVWLRAENPLNQELRKSKVTVGIKKVILGNLFRLMTDKCLFIGKENKLFFEYYGVPERKLLYTPYAVDNQFFNSAYEVYKGKEHELKQELGIAADKKVILFCGKYIEKKRPLDLLKAFYQLKSDDYHLVMVGEGELRQEMEQYILDNGIGNVLLTGFVNQSAIPKYYAIADVFVMCSGMGETWGLAVNEVMNFSKPVIVSATCGSAADLVKHGVNGYVFPEGDVEALVTHLKIILENEGIRSRMGDASFEIIQEYTIRHIVDNIGEAINNQSS